MMFVALVSCPVRQESDGAVSPGADMSRIYREPATTRSYMRAERSRHRPTQAQSRVTQERLRQSRSKKIMGLVHRSMLERSWLGDLGVWGSAKGSHVKLRSPLTKVSQCTTGKLHRGDELRLGCWSQTQINQDVNRGNFLQIPTSIANVKAPGSHLFRCVAHTACSVHGHRCLLLQACLDVP